jgi:hypothetical protein
LDTKILGYSGYSCLCVYTDFFLSMRLVLSVISHKLANFSDIHPN